MLFYHSYCMLHTTWGEGTHIHVLATGKLDLLGHPMLGLPGARNTSSEVRVIRQGTEVSSGLRAFSDKCGREDKRW